MPKKGYKQTKEHRKKLSDSHKGYKWTSVQKEKYIKSKTGKKRSDEIKIKFIGHNNPNWNGGKPRCPTCNKEISRGARACQKHKEITAEHKNNIKKSQTGRKNYWVKRGDKNPNWKGGISRNKHGCAEYREWRKSVFEKDDYTCQFCGKKGCYLEAHHIKAWAEYPKLRFNIINGLTLCKSCHQMTPNYKNKKYESIRQKTAFPKR